VGTVIAKGPVREASISAVVIRADGTREDLGVISHWHRNPVKRWLRAVKRGN
jgi:hypothetical protein